LRYTIPPPRKGDSTQGEHILEACTDECKFVEEQVAADEDITELAALLMEEQGLSVPTSPFEAAVLYVHLRNEISSAL